jgi:dipeptidyl aminopeptidase/acylaminoacyl peptidase
MLTTLWVRSFSLIYMEDGYPNSSHGHIDNIILPCSNIAGNKHAYFERSPINFVHKFTCPLILFHGLEDTVKLQGLKLRSGLRICHPQVEYHGILKSP